MTLILFEDSSVKLYQLLFRCFVQEIMPIAFKAALWTQPITLFVWIHFVGMIVCEQEA